jgi:hypothetical protein
LPSVFSQRVDDNIRQRDIPLPILRLGSLEPNTVGLCFLQRLSNANDLGIEVDIASTDRQKLASADAGK